MTNYKMKKAYRIYDNKSGEILLSFATTSDEKALEIAKEMYDMEGKKLEKWNGIQAPNKWTEII